MGLEDELVSEIIDGAWEAYICQLLRRATPVTPNGYGELDSRDQGCRLLAHCTGYLATSSGDGDGSVCVFTVADGRFPVVGDETTFAVVGIEGTRGVTRIVLAPLPSADDGCLLGQVTKEGHVSFTLCCAAKASAVFSGSASGHSRDESTEDLVGGASAEMAVDIDLSPNGLIAAVTIADTSVSVLALPVADWAVGNLDARPQQLWRTAAAGTFPAGRFADGNQRCGCPFVTFHGEVISVAPPNSNRLEVYSLTDPSETPIWHASTAARITGLSSVRRYWTVALGLGSC